MIKLAFFIGVFYSMEIFYFRFRSIIVKSGVLLFC
jgi:hypothetical protein